MPMSIRFEPEKATVTLLVPLGLLALLALPIIVWLHLIQERRRRVVVPSLLLWQHVPRKPDARRRWRLPMTLLLLLHLLAAALLALALTQPQWLGRLLGGGTHAAVIIDTSTSMAAGDASGTRLEQARNQARAEITRLGGSDSLTLITAGPQANLLATGGIEQRGNLLAALDTLAIDGTGTDIAGALTLAQAALEEEGGGRILILSDSALPELATALADGPTDLPLLPEFNVEWVSVGGSLENQGIVSFAARARQNRDATERTAAYVYARVANYSPNQLTTQLRLFGDDRLLDTNEVNLPAEGEAEFTWTTPPGVEVLRAELAGQDALPADNVAYLSLAQIRPINTLLVSDTPGPLERALQVVPGIELIVIAPGNYNPDRAPAAEADLTVFDNTLPARWPSGGVLVINPPAGTGPLLTVGDPFDLDAESRRPALRVASSAEGATGQLLEGLSLDSVNFGIVSELQTPEWAAVLLRASYDEDDAGWPLILRGRVAQSEVAIWTFDLEDSNLTERLAFPLLVARTVRDLTPMPLPSALLAGEPLPLQPSPRTTTIMVEPPEGESGQMVVSPTVQLDTLTQPGIYTIVERAQGETLYAGRTAVNAGTPVESDLRPRPIPPDLGMTVAATEAAADGEPVRRERQPFWPWLAVAALIVMVVEWVYVHR
ncbi:MAG: vWA domain-containing protein [Chloroflexaceae bacterium]